ncbi:MAG: hypothetical protein ACRC8S_08830 [Fimbriiglobus sp.]
MPIWGWVCVGLFWLFVVYTIFAAIREALTKSKVRSKGITVVAHIIAADDKLYTPRLNPDDKHPNSASATVVFTLDDTLSDERYTKLETYAETLRNYTAADSSTGEYDITLLKNPSMPCPRPLRLNDRITGGEEVYAASVDVFCKFLPGGVLTQRYIHCKALVGAGIVMIESPPTDWVPPSNGFVDSVTATSSGGTPTPSRPAFHLAAMAVYDANFSQKTARKTLLELGCSEDDVDAIVNEAWREYISSQRKKGLMQDLIGFAMFLAGIGLTVMTYRQAEASGGGSYVVMTGLILVGAWNAFRGAVRSIGGR